MPSVKEHYDKYSHNKVFVKEGMKNNNVLNFDDWEIVVHFYTAIHLIEAVLHKKCGAIDGEVNDHTKRQNCMNKRENQSVFKNSLLKHKLLKDLAHKARYCAKCNIKAGDVGQARTYLYEIEREIKDHVV